MSCPTCGQPLTMNCYGIGDSCYNNFCPDNIHSKERAYRAELAAEQKKKDEATARAVKQEQEEKVLKLAEELASRWKKAVLLAEPKPNSNERRTYYTCKHCGDDIQWFQPVDSGWIPLNKDGTRHLCQAKAKAAENPFEADEPCPYCGEEHYCKCGD